MKELSIEQKAKAYDKAIKRAKELLEIGVKDTRDKRVVLSFFPELKESSDEEIKKDIVTAVETYGDFTQGRKEEIYTWLEKQNSKVDNVNKEYWRGYYDGKLAKEYNITGIGSKNAHGKLGEMIKNLKPVNEVLEQKPADKVEPKFHKGDWIIHQGTENIYQVVAVIDNQYQLKYGDNYTTQYCTDVDRCTRLWNITKDAKDGDILQLGMVTAIFKELIDDGVNCKCYCSVYNGEFEIPSQDGIDNSYGCHDATPATKEQRDALEKALTDAGYTFDFKKKELKKIEQKPAVYIPKFHVGDKLVSTYDPSLTYEVLEVGHINELGNPDYKVKIFTDGKVENHHNVQYAECHRVDEWAKLIEHKTAWSEEDERIRQCLIRDQEKALDDVRNDKYGHSEITSDLKEMYRERIDWLKSLRPQNMWKPSEEQIKALAYAVFDTQSYSYHKNLSSLEQQLKKL